VIRAPGSGLWLPGQKSLPAVNAADLAGLRAETEAVLAGPSAELPKDLFGVRKDGSAD
jgi:hypothetical protein